MEGKIEAFIDTSMTQLLAETDLLTQDTEQYSPLIRELYCYMQNPAMHSEFLEELSVIISYMRRYFRKGPPIFYLDTWRKRLEELDTLEAAVSVAKITNEDLPLILLCRDIISNEQNSLFNWYAWNDLPKKLTHLQLRYFTDNKLTINLISVNENDVLRRTNLSLICAYIEIYKQLKSFERSIETYEDLFSFDHYTRLCVSKDRVIDQLKNKMSVLISENEKLQKSKKRNSELLEIYKHQNTKLSEQLNFLFQKIEKAMVQNKYLYDQISLLRQEIELLKLEKAQETAKNLRLQQALDSKSSATVENEILKLRLLKLPESDIPQPQPMNNKVSHSHTEKFAKLAAKNKIAIRELSNSINNMFDEMRSHVNDDIISHLAEIKGLDIHPTIRS